MGKSAGTGTPCPLSQFESSPSNSMYTTGAWKPLNGRRRLRPSPNPGGISQGEGKYRCPIYGTSCHRYQHDKQFFNTVAEVKKDIKEHLCPYHCDTCGYQTGKLSHINRHFGKKRKCKKTESRGNISRLPDDIAVRSIVSLDAARGYREVCDAMRQFSQCDADFPPNSYDDFLAPEEPTATTNSISSTGQSVPLPINPLMMTSGFTGTSITPDSQPVQFIRHLYEAAPSLRPQYAAHMGSESQNESFLVTQPPETVDHAFPDIPGPDELFQNELWYEGPWH